MKVLMIVVTCLIATSAFAAKKVELTGSCLSAVEDAIHGTYDGEDNGCVTGASVERVSKLKGTVVSVNFSRAVCEGYDNGEADVTLEIRGKVEAATKITISKCKVTNVVITDESAD